MTGGKILDRIEIDLRDYRTRGLHTIYLDVYDNSLSRKWLTALNDLLDKGYHLEKNYCFLGFAENDRNGSYILDQVNQSIKSINDANIGYQIDDYFSLDNTLSNVDDRKDYGQCQSVRHINQDKLNRLHRYFEDLQGVSGNISSYYLKADPGIRWHIRQLNLLCHEFESWALSYRKQLEAPEWQRPSTLMCWLNSPRFILDEEDLELFGIETINRPTGGVFVGVNKAVGKHHWEVFSDEGRDSRVGELVSTTLRSQTEAAGDFDIEWGLNPSGRPWQQDKLTEFRQWLIDNNFDPDDKSLTIGHPQVGQVDLQKSFGTNGISQIWSILNKHLDIFVVRTSDAEATYDYHWSDSGFQERQISIISKGY